MLDGWAILLMRGMLFGIGAAAPIGPVNVEMARRALRFGFVPAFALGCGAVTIDISYAVIAALGVAPLLSAAQARSGWSYWTLAVAGAGILTYLGVMNIRSARSVARIDLSGGDARADRGAARGVRDGYITGLLMTGLSPMTLAFWFIVLPQWAGSVTVQPRHDLPIIVLGVFLATIAWVIGFAGLLSVAGRWRRRWWMIAADEFGGAVLILLAAGALLRSLRNFYNPPP